MTLGAYCKYLSGADFKWKAPAEKPRRFSSLSRGGCVRCRGEISHLLRVACFSGPADRAFNSKWKRGFFFARGCLAARLRHAGTVQNHHPLDMHLPRLIPRRPGRKQIMRNASRCLGFVAVACISPDKNFISPHKNFISPPKNSRLHQMVRTEGSNGSTYICCSGGTLREQPFLILGIYTHSTTYVLLIFTLYNRAANQRVGLTVSL